MGDATITPSRAVTGAYAVQRPDAHHEGPSAQRAAKWLSVPVAFGAGAGAVIGALTAAPGSRAVAGRMGLRIGAGMGAAIGVPLAAAGAFGDHPKSSAFIALGAGIAGGALVGAAMNPRGGAGGRLGQAAMLAVFAGAPAGGLAAVAATSLTYDPNLHRSSG